MKPLDRLKLILVLAALAVWAVGVRSDNRILTWVAIGFVAVAFLVRFLPRKRE